MIRRPAQGPAARAEPSPLGPKTPLTLAGPTLLGQAFAEVEQQLLRLDRGLDPEVVHQARTATRRLRVAMLLLGARPLRDLAPGVKALQDALGRLRDLQVQGDWLSARTEQAAHALAAAIRQTAPASERGVRLSLALFAQRTGPRILAAIANVRRGKLGGHRMRAALREATRRTQKAAARAGRMTPKSAHRLRRRIKREGDLARLLRQGLPAQTKAALHKVDAAKDELGALHDAHVRLALLGRELPKLIGGDTKGAGALRRAVANEVRKRGRRARKLRRRLTK